MRLSVGSFLNFFLKRSADDFIGFPEFRDSMTVGDDMRPGKLSMNPFLVRNFNDDLISPF